jgi:hypothetical protein
MATIAEQISRVLGDDGTVWETTDGRTLEDLAEEHGGVAAQHPDRPYLTRYVFGDGSAIVASEGAWDLEGSTPWSWAGEEEWIIRIWSRLQVDRARRTGSKGAEPESSC